MEKKRVIWSKKALSNLKALFNFVAKEKNEPENAEKLINDILNFSEKIGENPQAYPIEEDVSDDKTTYRKAVFKKNYRFIFRVKQTLVIIANFFHNKRNPNDKMK
jgi:plasmid stabilization system protein ParE